MTPRERRLLERTQRRVSRDAPELARAIEKAFAALRTSLPEAELIRLIENGSIYQVVASMVSDAALKSAFAPAHQQLQSTVAASVEYSARHLPRKVVRIAFDVLNPRHIDAIRKLDTEVLQVLETETRETVRAFVENGLRDGTGPRTIARDLRQIVGLAPKDAQAVANFRRMLEQGDRTALRRALRDRRFDGTLDRVLGSGDGLKKPQIDTMVDAYARRSLKNRAETIARTAANETLKVGNRLAVEDGVELGALDGETLFRRWVTTLDGRERLSHREMHGEVARWDQPYRNGQMYPGENEYNCRCVEVYFISRAPLQIAA